MEDWNSDEWQGRDRQELTNTNIFVTFIIIGLLLTILINLFLII